MFIQTEETPNPATLKFVPGIKVMPKGTAAFAKIEDCGDSPLAKKLFQTDHVRGVFFGSDFISITILDYIVWQEL